MKKIITFILTFIPLTIWAHQDRFFTYEYANVTVRFKTGFFFEEINNAKIIGQYAAYLSDSLGYEKPVLLDFIHDYGHSYEGEMFSFLNIGSEEYKMVSYYELIYDSLMDGNVYRMVSYHDSIEAIKDIKKEVYTMPRINKKKTIVIRQFGFHFDIIETMNLLHYAITNGDGVRQNTRRDTLPSYLRNMYYSFESIPSVMVDSIKLCNTTLVERVLKTKVYNEVDSFDHNQLNYSYYSQNGKFYIFAKPDNNKTVIDTLKQIYSFNPREFLFEKMLFVFETPNQMRVYNASSLTGDQFKRSKKHLVNIDPYVYVKSINIEWLGGDIYLVDYSNGFVSLSVKKLLYLRNDDVLIEGFEEYIDSYRKEKD